MDDNKKENKDDTTKDISSIQLIFKKIRKLIEYYLEKVLRVVFFWEKDNRRLGLILRTLHNILIISLLFLYIFSHTIFPSFILLISIWCMSSIIFLLHLLTGGCLCTKLEYKLTGERKTIVDPILEIFHIPVTKETVNGFTILGSTVFFSFLSMEILFHILRYLRSMMSLIF
jgi:hypothetical protein